MISLTGIVKRYRMGEEEFNALAGIDLHIERNEYVALTGPSGSGKSSLMNILGCLDTPTSGHYILNGRDVATLTDHELAAIRNKEIGFVFQSFHLLTRMSVLQNVCQPLIYRGTPPAERIRLATESLQRVGLGSKLKHLPNQLSGGQRQRVAVARALVGRPSILLADEPTGNLDSKTSEEIMALFNDLHSEGQTVILVTHEADIAAHAARVIRLVDGKIESDIRQERVTCTS